MLFRSNMQNFAAIASAFISAGGAIQVREAAELEQVLGELLGDAARRDALGRNALKVVRENQGAVERTVDMIVRHLEGGELYVPPKKLAD